MISRADFTPVTLENKHILETYFARYPQYHSESSIITILSWEHYAQCSFAEYKNHLIIDCCVDGEHGIHTPIGEFDAELLEELLIFVRDENFALEIYEEESREYLQNTHPEIPITENREYFEYVYSTENLAALKGRKYLNIRGQINTFTSRWKYRVEKITPENIPEVLALAETWGRTKDLEADTIMREELTAVRYSFRHWEKLPLAGIAVRITETGTLAGMAVWEIQNEKQALIHFEKGLSAYPGIYKIINKETARELFGKVEWINRESDMGHAGLREAKLRYHPDFFVKAYYILPEDIPATLTYNNS